MIFKILRLTKESGLESMEKIKENNQTYAHDNKNENSCQKITTVRRTPTGGPKQDSRERKGQLKGLRARLKAQEEGPLGGY